MDQTLYDYKLLYFIAVVSLLIILFAMYYFEEWHEKIIALFLLGGTTIYSGLGISTKIVDSSYTSPFFMFLLFEFIGLSCGFNFHLNNLFTKQTNNNTTQFNDRLLKLSFIGYWLIIVILLVYPVNHLQNIFSIQFDITGVFENRVVKRSNNLIYILTLLSLILSPLYCISLSRLNTTYIIIILTLEEYSIGLRDNYIGRTEIMMFFLRIIFIITIMRKSTGKRSTLTKQLMNFDKKRSNAYSLRLGLTILFTLLFFIVSVPFFTAYRFLRHGDSYMHTNYSSDLIYLIEKETSYPTLYDFTESIANEIASPMEYLYWFITLPIPKELFNLPKALLLNYAFSELYFGKDFGDSGFTVVLSSLFGEGMLIWGRKFSFIHAFFISFVWGLMNSYLKRHNELIILHIFFVIRTLNLIRGGSQGSISHFVNILVPFIIISYCYNIFCHPKELPRNEQSI